MQCCRGGGGLAGGEEGFLSKKGGWQDPTRRESFYVLYFKSQLKILKDFRIQCLGQFEKKLSWRGDVGGEAHLSSGRRGLSCLGDEEGGNYEDNS